MKDNLKKYLYISFAVFLAIAFSILFFFLMFRASEFGKDVKKLISILNPFIYGAVIAYLLWPLSRFFEEKMYNLLDKKTENIKASKMQTYSRIFGIIVAFVIAILFIYVICLMIIPQIVSSIAGIIEIIPDNFNRFVLWLENLVADNQILLQYTEQFSGQVSTWFESILKDTIIPNIQTIVNGFSIGIVSVIVVLKNLIIGIIVAVYLLMGRTRLLRQSKLILNSICKKRWAEIIQNEVKFTDRMFSGFIYGKIIDSLIIGLLCFIGLNILNIPYAMLVSVIVGITNIIPFFGPYFGAVPSALIILMVSPMKCLYFIIFIIVLQQVDGNIIGPRILGNTTGLSSFWVLFSILLFGGLYGFIGMIIGVPVFAVIYDIIAKLVRKGLNRNEQNELLREYEDDFKEQ